MLTFIAGVFVGFAALLGLGAFLKWNQNDSWVGENGYDCYRVFDMAQIGALPPHVRAAFQEEFNRALPMVWATVDAHPGAILRAEQFIFVDDDDNSELTLTEATGTLKFPVRDLGTGRPKG